MQGCVVVFLLRILLLFLQFHRQVHHRVAAVAPPVADLLVVQVVAVRAPPVADLLDLLMVCE